MSDSTAHRQTPLVPRSKALRGLVQFVKNPILILDQYLEEYGDTFWMYMGGVQKAMTTVDPVIIQHVLQKNHRNYRKSEIQTKKLAHFLGKGLLTSDGEYWLRQRRLIQPGFHRERLRGLTDLMQDVIDDYTEKFDRAIAGGRPVDVYQHMMELAFRVIARALFSTSLKEEELNHLATTISEVQEFVIRTIRQPVFTPWFRLSGQYRKHEAAVAQTDEIILRYIHERRGSETSRDDLLQMLLDARYEDTGKGMTDRQLLDEVSILFIAGHETTANALSWTWYLLARHPEVVEKLRRELARELGARSPTFLDLRKLEYLTQVIEESMRLYPPAWITDRVAISDDEVNGHFIPKDTIVILYIYGAHHHTGHWPDPDVFRPERFSPENKKNHSAFAYLPFGGGPRMCIGNNFAMMEMQLILASMIRRYDFQLVADQDIELQPLVTLRPRNGIRMRVKRL